MKAPLREVPAFDPYVSYQIKALNRAFDGDSNGVRFINGVGVVNALPTDADMEDVDERLELLMWFFNANPLLKKVATDPSDPNSPEEWRTYTAYEIEPYDSNTMRTEKTKRSRDLVGSGAKGAA